MFQYAPPLGLDPNRRGEHVLIQKNNTCISLGLQMPSKKILNLLKKTPETALGVTGRSGTKEKSPIGIRALGIFFLLPRGFLVLDYHLEYLQKLILST